MNKTNYINLNEETENNFTLGKNNDIMKLYGRLKEITVMNTLKHLMRLLQTQRMEL